MLQSLIPAPLHPAVVHLPIALTILLPLFAIGALVAISRGARPTAVWGTTTALAVLLAASAWVSIETGEGQEDRVERIVGERPLETHEEAAEAFLLIAGGMVGLSALGLARGKIGHGARIAGVVGTFVVAGAGWNVGHSGGALVYQHGAASAYAAGEPAVTADARNAAPGQEDEDDDR
jgi:uncharacterized membrane protein